MAENLPGLFQILTFDAEPMVDWDKVTYYKPKDNEDSDGAAEYARWLMKTFQLKPAKDDKEVGKLVAAAQKAHGAAFKTWMGKYHK